MIKHLQRKQIVPFFMALASVAVAEPKDVPTTVENGALVRRNGAFFNNRPLYANQDNPEQRYYWVFAGDKPFVRFGGGTNMDGNFLPGFQRGDGTAKWFQDFKSVEARYRCGQMEWVLSDPDFPGVSITLETLPTGTGFGMAAQAKLSGAQPTDRLVWIFGASHTCHVQFTDPLAIDSAGRVRKEGFSPANAEKNGIEIKDGTVLLDKTSGFKSRHTVFACSEASDIRVADAAQWQSPATLAASTGTHAPVAYGVTPAVNDRPITFIAKVFLDKDSTPLDVAAEYRAARARVDAFANRVTSKTPDARFDFMVQAATSPSDALWRKEAFGHSSLSQFVDPLLGWRSTFAGVAYGWHDRVTTAARTFFASQVTGESYKEHPNLAKIIDNNIELDRFEGTGAHPARDLRFHGKGRLIPNQNSTLYDMQSQFFDMVIENWRFTGDPELEKLLRPALELHLGYLARAFDPDNNGTYESISNTFLTDTVWTNGGGTPEESAFAFRGHLAARDMARRAGDTQGVKHHEAMLALIRKGFFEDLWSDKYGRPGAYREQGGHKRLHDDPWTPGLYMPIDATGLLNEEQMASTLHFTEYGLQREPRPSGGVRLYPSNWVPTIWSNRHKSPGDEHHMALGYCLAGMPEGAFEIINGNISEEAFESGVPGNIGFNYPGLGTDFGDCVGGFTRTVVSGVFGYRPDMPNKLVTIAPQFPADWAYGSFSHPEFKMDYRREGNRERLSAELVRDAQIELQLPFRATAIKSATLNGKKVKGEIRPGFGRSIYVVRAPAGKKAELVLELDGQLPQAAAQSREVEVGDTVEFAVEGGRVAELRDAQKVLASSKIDNGKAKASISNNTGHHRVLAVVEVGKMPQYRIFDFNVRDKKAEQYVAEKNLREAPANAQWTGIDLSGVLNACVTDIFRQQYLSPRPDTASLRLAKDGYGVWNALYAGKLPPTIDLSNTRPRRPVPVYDAAVGDLKIGEDMTLEMWATFDVSDETPWSTTRMLELGDLKLDIYNVVGGLIRISAPEPVYHSSTIFCGERVGHIAVVFRAGNEYGEVYRDGKISVDHPRVNRSTLKLGPTLRLGATSTGDSRMLGHIHRVAIAKKAASAQEIASRPLDAAPLPETIMDWQIPETDAPEQVESKIPGAPALVRQDVAFKRPKNLSEPLKVADGMLEVPQGARFKWNPKPKDIAFTSLWDNWPHKVEVPVNKSGDSAWLLVAGSTNPMQVRIANAVLRFHYADGVTEELELVNPMNFWSLSTFQWADYDYKVEGFSLPKVPPSQVQLGSNCRAMVYGWKLRPGVELKSVTLESLSEEVIIGLMGLSICNQ